MEPWSFTLAELHDMMIGRQRAEWQRAAMLTATVKNLFVTKKSNLVSPESLNPYRERKEASQERVLKVDKNFMIDIWSEMYGSGTGRPRKN